VQAGLALPNRSTMRADQTKAGRGSRPPHLALWRIVCQVIL